VNDLRVLRGERALNLSRRICQRVEVEKNDGLN
jgi:hypothetical protein